MLDEVVLVVYVRSEVGSSGVGVCDEVFGGEHEEHVEADECGSDPSPGFGYVGEFGLRGGSHGLAGLCE